MVIVIITIAAIVVIVATVVIMIVAFIAVNTNASREFHMYLHISFPWLQRVTLPGYLLALCALIAAALSISAIKFEGAGWAQGAKVVVFLSIFLSLVALITFMLAAILGLVAGSSTIENT